MTSVDATGGKAGQMLAVLKLAGCLTLALFATAFVGPSNSFGEESIRLHHYAETMLTGELGTEISVPQASCEKVCSERAKCVGFDYTAETRNCRIFTSVTGAQSNPGSTSATRNIVANYQTPPSPDQFFKYTGTALSGKVTAEVSLPFAACEKQCVGRSGCVGFDYGTISGQCRFYASIAGAVSTPGLVAASRTLVDGYGPPDNPPVPPSAPTPPPAPVAPSPAKVVVSEKMWVHNGSLVKMVQKTRSDGGVDVQIVYEQPRRDLIPVGVTKGTVLFVGSASGDRLVGKARLNSPKCGQITYSVSGDYDPTSQTSFSLTGAAPKRGDDCNVQSWSATGSNANLLFDPGG